MLIIFGGDVLPDGCRQFGRVRLAKREGKDVAVAGQMDGQDLDDTHVDMVSLCSGMMSPSLTLSSSSRWESIWPSLQRVP